MKRTPQLAFEYDPTVERGVRMTQLIDELAPDRRRVTCRRSRTLCVRTTASCWSPTRTRTATRSARCSRRSSRSTRSARTARCTSTATRRCRASTASCRSRASAASRPRTPPSACCVALDCANEQRIGPDPTLLEQAPLTLDIDHHHDNSRFGDLNLVVGDASSTGEVLRDVFARARRRADARDRGGALHRASSPTPAASSTRTRRRRRSGSRPSWSRRAPTCTGSSRASTSRSSSPS